MSAKPAVAVSVEVGGSGGGLCATSLAVSTANGLPMALGLAVASCSEVCWCCDIAFFLLLLQIKEGCRSG